VIKQTSSEYPVADAHAFYCRALESLRAAQSQFLVGGAFAFHHYTGIERDTKDFDIFVRPRDRATVMNVLSRAGYHVELSFHWLGKAFAGDHFIDVIFRSGNGFCEVDDSWFTHAVDGEMWGFPAKLCPAEEIIWSKAYIMERERFDGADVAHLLRARAHDLDWTRLVARFGPHWRVLLTHLILYGFIYPGERSRIPEEVMRHLLGRLNCELSSNHSTVDAPLCQGSLLSREQYLVDLEQWGYRDARLSPEGCLTTHEIEHWTAAINRT